MKEGWNMAKENWDRSISISIEGGCIFSPDMNLAQYIKRVWNRDYGGRIVIPDGPSCFVPLLPRHGIDLFFLDGDGPRFARIFRQVWKKLPQKDKDLLLKDWQEAKQDSSPWLRFPLFELITDKADFYDGDSLLTFAQYNPGRRSFSFRSQTVDFLPEKQVKFVIAHELAHAVLGIMDPKHSDSAEAGIDEKELSADAMAEYWGFPAPSEHYKIKV